MIENIFKYRRVNVPKLKEYGFVEQNRVYRYETPIVNGQFILFVTVKENGDVSTRLIDTESQDEYVLHLVEGSAGEFVGTVRTAFEEVLTDIRGRCFEVEIFKSEQAKQVIEYIRTRYGDELEHLWAKFPSNAIWRRKDNQKWYGILLLLPKRKLGLEGDEIVEIIDLRIAPSKIDQLVDGKTYFAGYHMNKRSWVTICLDGSVPTQAIFEYIDNSYRLALKK